MKTKSDKVANTATPTDVVNLHLSPASILGKWLLEMLSIRELYTWDMSSQEISLVLDCALSAHTKTHDKLMTIDTKKSITMRALTEVRLLHFQASDDHRHQAPHRNSEKEVFESLLAFAPHTLFEAHQPRFMRLEQELERLNNTPKLMWMARAIYALIGIIEGRERELLKHLAVHGPNLEYMQQ